jgi:hypothetical protein
MTSSAKTKAMSRYLIIGLRNGELKSNPLPTYS